MYLSWDYIAYFQYTNFAYPYYSHINRWLKHVHSFRNIEVEKTIHTGITNTEEQNHMHDKAS